MVSSYWANLNANIKFETTKKQYYSRYLWRLVYEIKKVSLASDKHVCDVSSYVKERRRVEAMNKKYPPSAYGAYDYGGYSYNQRHRETWDGVDEVLIDRIRTIMETFKAKAKFRTEFNTMQIYAETEEDLQRIAEAISYSEGMTTINSPKPGTEDSLRNGFVYMNKINYKFKVILRDGNYDPQTKGSIWAQLKQREDIKIPSHLKRELSKKYPALWGAYFYTNDDSIVTVLSLISPGIIGKIHPIETLNK